MQVLPANIVPLVRLIRGRKGFSLSEREFLKGVLHVLGFTDFLIGGFSQVVWVEVLEERNFKLFFETLTLVR